MIALIFIFYLGTRLWPLWQYGERAFGYDTGIYRHYIDGYFLARGSATLPPFAFSAYSNLLKLFGLSTDAVMFVCYFLLASGIFWLLYFVVKRYFNRGIAVAAVLLFTVSLVQYEFYWWYYYRQFLALFFLLLFLWLFISRRWWSIIPLAISVSLHPLTALPVLAALLFYGLLDREKRKTTWGVLAGATFFVLALNWRELWHYFNFWRAQAYVVGNFSDSSELSGQFLAGGAYLRFTIFYLAFAIFGLIKYWRQQKFLALVLFLSALFYASKIIFYRRFLMLLDLTVLIFAAAFIVDYGQKIFAHWLGKATVVIYILMLVTSLLTYVYYKEPLITAAAFTAITSANYLPQVDYVMAVSSVYAPWLYGYMDKKVIAPGMLDYNLWNYDKWVKFWTTTSSSERYALLLEYNSSPIYLFLGEQSWRFKEILQDDNHFCSLNDYWWRFDR